MHQLVDKKNKIIIYIIFLLILSTTSGKYNENKSIYSLKISKINIDGLSKANEKEILKELNNLSYKNILFIGKGKITKTISKYNIIEEYRVKKIYPSTININIKPTKFIARISNNDQLLVGANGKLIINKNNETILPYLFGKFNSKEFLIFKKNIELSKFAFKKIKALYFFPSRRWDILTNKDILIKLPKDKISESLNLAYEMINNDDFKNKNLIDLRVNKHLIIK
jgi:cell division protein FtsQ